MDGVRCFLTLFVESTNNLTLRLGNSHQSFKHSRNKVRVSEGGQPQSLANNNYYCITETLFSKMKSTVPKIVLLRIGFLISAGFLISGTIFRIMKIQDEMTMKAITSAKTTITKTTTTMTTMTTTALATTTATAPATTLMAGESQAPGAEPPSEPLLRAGHPQQTGGQDAHIPPPSATMKTTQASLPSLQIMPLNIASSSSVSLHDDNNSNTSSSSSSNNSSSSSNSSNGNVIHPTLSPNKINDTQQQEQQNKNISFYPPTTNNRTTDPPPPKKFNNIVVMGQFNYVPTDLDLIATWVNVWKSRFEHVIVRGPFNENQTATLQTKYSIDAKCCGRSDRGFISPIENFMTTLMEYHNKTEGVLYIHDDAILNITELVGKQSSTTTTTTTTSSSTFPTNEIIANGHIIVQDYSYEDPRLQNLNTTNISKFAYYIHVPKSKEELIKQQQQQQEQVDGNNTNITAPPRPRPPPTATIMETMDGRYFNFDNATQREEFYRTIDDWFWYRKRMCIPALSQLAKSTEMDPYRESSQAQVQRSSRGTTSHDEGTTYKDFYYDSRSYRDPLLMSPYVQGDFLFVPTSIAQEFYDIAKVFVKYSVFLECAWGTIVDLVRQRTAMQVRRMPLCTTWEKERGIRGTPEMIELCHKEQQKTNKQPFGIYHPIKMGKDPQRFIDEFQRFST